MPGRAALAAAGVLAACGGAGPPPPRGAPGARAVAAVNIVDEIDAELTAASRGLTGGHRATFRSILDDTLEKDPYLCRPLPREVFFGSSPPGTRTIAGVMPHYGFFFGPMHYRVRRRGPGEPPGWEVSVVLALDLPRAARLELPDCALAGRGARCAGTPYEDAPGTDACPGSGMFSLPATEDNARALLARWSEEAERYYNRDADYFGLPVHYDFEFIAAPAAPGAPVDLATGLSPTCGRTPYFSAFRSGWSMPIVAHEVGHVLGLLDEYEAFSGLASIYPKTPFPGAERSRMGLSMRKDTRVLPLHHYLILRRALCDEPARGSFYEAAPPM